MDRRRALDVLTALGAAAPGGVLLWRGEDLDGSDLDVVVLDGSQAAVARSLQESGLTAAPQDPGHVLWRLLPGETVVVDALAAHAWPAMYPALDGVVDRSVRRPDGLLVAAEGDRQQIHAAEAVAGWPLEKVLRRLNGLTGAAPCGSPALAALGARPERLAGPARRGRLGLRAAVRAGLPSATGRAALRARLRTALGFPVRPPLPPVPRSGGHPGVLIAVSGMDGAGKSTAALGIAEALEGAGRPVLVYWTRVGGETHLLELLGRPARRLLGRAPGSSQAPPDPGREPSRGLVYAVWAAIVAADSARAARRAHLQRRRGYAVVCDRWLADALVDHRIRYGRHRVAEWTLRHAFPAPDVGLLLAVDPETAARRKPGDQAPEVLRAMAELYDRYAADCALVRIDAAASREEVGAAVRAALPADLRGTATAAERARAGASARR